MKKILILTVWFDWGWSWKIASIIENFLNKTYETVTLVFFEDKWFYNIKWKKTNIWTFFNFWFPLSWCIEIIYHIISTIKYIKNERPDVVIWIWTYCNLLCLISRKFLKFKLLLSQHEHITTQISSISKLSPFRLVFLMIKLLIWNNKIICVSNSVKLDTINYYWIKENQAQTIYNWFDFDEIKKMWNEKIYIKEKYIINIWRLDELKNQELLIKAYSKSKIKEAYKLLLLWEWNKEGDLKYLCKELDIDNSVIFLWYEKNPYKYLKRSSLFCFTSKTEALPTVIIEALILNTPIITVPVTWTNEILNNGEFWIITKDYNELTLVKELDNFTIQRNNSFNNKKLEFLNENFSLNSMEKKYLEIISTL